jgi:hypothetical protein
MSPLYSCDVGLSLELLLNRLKKLGVILFECSQVVIATLNNLLTSFFGYSVHRRQIQPLFARIPQSRLVEL